MTTARDEVEKIMTEAVKNFCAVDRALLEISYLLAKRIDALEAKSVIQHSERESLLNILADYTRGSE
jgi:hypothetical protein